MEAVKLNLRSTEKWLSRDPVKAKIYEAEIHKLIEAGPVTNIDNPVAESSGEAWNLPHHLVSHNFKDCLVLNCSFTRQGTSLNQQLLPEPTLGPSLLGVLLWFRQHAIISGDIKAMFHQVRLLPEDRPLQ